MAVTGGRLDGDVFRQYLQVFDHNLKSACQNLPPRVADDDLRREVEISSARREREHKQKLADVQAQLTLQHLGDKETTAVRQEVLQEEVKQRLARELPYLEEREKIANEKLQEREHRFRAEIIDGELAQKLAAANLRLKELEIEKKERNLRRKELHTPKERRPKEHICKKEERAPTKHRRKEDLRDKELRAPKERRPKEHICEKEERAPTKHRRKEDLRDKEERAPKERRRKEKRESKMSALADATKIGEHGSTEEKEEPVTESALMVRSKEKSKSPREKSKSSREKSKSSREKSKSSRLRSKPSALSAKKPVKSPTLRSTKEPRTSHAAERGKSSSMVKTSELEKSSKLSTEKLVESSATLARESPQLPAPSTHTSQSSVKSDSLDRTQKLKSSRDLLQLPEAPSARPTSETSSPTPSALESESPRPSAQGSASAALLARVESDSLHSKQKSKSSQDLLKLCEALSARPTSETSSPTPSAVESESPMPSAQDSASVALLARKESEPPVALVQYTNLPSEQSKSSKPAMDKGASAESRSPSTADLPPEQSKSSKPAMDKGASVELRSPSTADLPSEQSKSSKPAMDAGASEESHSLSSVKHSGVPMESAGSAKLTAPDDLPLPTDSMEMAKYAMHMRNMLCNAPPHGRLRRKDIGDSPEALEEQAEIMTLHFEENMNEHFQLVQRWQGTARGAAGGDNFQEQGYAAAVWGWVGYTDPILVANVDSVAVEGKTATRIGPFVEQAVVFIETLPVDAGTGVFFEVRLDGKDWGELDDGIAIGFTRKDTAESVPIASDLLDLWGIGFVPLCPDSDISDFLTAVTLAKSNGAIDHLEPTAWETQDLRPGDTVAVWWSPEGIYFLRNLCVVAQIPSVRLPPPSDLLGFFDLTGCATKATLLSNFTMPTEEFKSLDHTVGVAVGLSLMHVRVDGGMPSAFVQHVALARNHPEGYLYMVLVKRRGHGTVKLGHAKDASGTDATLVDLGAACAVDNVGAPHLMNAANVRGAADVFTWNMVLDEDTIGLLLVPGKWILLHNYIPVAMWKMESFQIHDVNGPLHAYVELSSAGQVDFIPPAFAKMFGLCTGHAVLTADRLTARVTRGASEPGLPLSEGGRYDGLIYSDEILVPRIIGFTFTIHVLIGGNVCIGLTNEDVLDADDYEVAPPARPDYAWFGFAGRVHPQGKTSAGSGGHFIKGTTIPEDGDWVQIILMHGQSRALVFKNGERCGHTEVTFAPPYYAFVALDDPRTIITL